MKKIITIAAAIAGLAAGDCLAQSAFEQLAPSKGGEAGIIAVPLPDRFPSSLHSSFGTALDLAYKPESAYGDYYPFSGDTKEASNLEGPDTTVPGLLSGMSDESGHPSLLANGGDARSYWESALGKYKALRFAEAYHDIGILCHLTQDQAVPAHAANINHVKTMGDNFEKAAGTNLALLTASNASAAAVRLPALKPYEYYQALQDDTRRRLPGWTDPRNGRAYWLPAQAAPAAGKDATAGPWGSYPDGKDAFDALVSPEIITRQGLMAAVYTRETLRSAARLLPPAVSRFQARRTANDKLASVRVTFKVYDNKSGTLKITVTRPLHGQVKQAVLTVRSSGATIPSAAFTAVFDTPSPVNDEDVLVLSAEDADGNVTELSTKAVYRANN